MDAHPRSQERRPAGRTVRAAAIAAGLGLVLLAQGCGRDEGRNPVSRVAGLVQSRLRGRAVLRVEKSEYFNADFRAYLETAGADAKGLAPEALSRLFDRFVDEAVLLEAARARGITLSEAEKTEYLAKRAVAAGPGDVAGPAGEAPPERAFDRLLVEKYTVLVVRDVRVDEAEILAYYERHKKDFLQRARVQVSQILVDTEEKAVSVVRRLERTGEAEFRTIAREESLGPEAPRDGVMGVFEQGDLPADMEKVIFALDEGRTSQVVESSYGFHVFRLDRLFPPALRSAAEAAPAIRQLLLAQKMKEALAVHLGGLKDTLSWESHPGNLFFSYERSDE